ncbi:hypothetical protein BDV35DRAFT_354486 [Aspergillus flavus]|uniref:Secreted protein n=1 Tax=Aspergillus flavus TaxID=5059 RepID=A0A5N6GWB6_ASPFL|nr:hypothetical protein BDV35DRAFT_354486 [Aspergillus flavus]
MPIIPCDTYLILTLFSFPILASALPPGFVKVSTAFFQFFWKPLPAEPCPLQKSANRCTEKSRHLRGHNMLVSHWRWR